MIVLDIPYNCLRQFVVKVCYLTVRGLGPTAMGLRLVGICPTVNRIARRPVYVKMCYDSDLKLMFGVTMKQLPLNR